MGKGDKSEHEYTADHQRQGGRLGSLNEKLLLLSGKAERADVGNDFERIGVDVSGPVDDRIDGVYGNLLMLGVLRRSSRSATKTLCTRVTKTA